MTAREAVDALTRLLAEENAALGAGDASGAARFAAEKEGAAARLAEAAPEIAALRRGPGGREVEARLAALGAELRRNAGLVAHAAGAARDLLAALEAAGGRAGGYDARGARTPASRRGAVLNDSL